MPVTGRSKDKRNLAFNLLRFFCKHSWFRPLPPDLGIHWRKCDEAPKTTLLTKQPQWLLCHKLCIFVAQRRLKLQLTLPYPASISLRGSPMILHLFDSDKLIACQGAARHTYAWPRLDSLLVHVYTTMQAHFAIQRRCLDWLLWQMFVGMSSPPWEFISTLFRLYRTILLTHAQARLSRSQLLQDGAPGCGRWSQSRFCSILSAPEVALLAQ